ncbi:magnesium transporter CorA family protein [Neobacillus sp. SuZ13]|uniref:magnesium transporter CorA family protein n=1 Tax=Neobacillus sp. SuZ13 TaxID=3047875 RepID=UPI0024C08122|nr:magnesium transporter CorA family protein [Neobacillus sp. SuZ13]WHY66934.1 magnesium transporter CorA family protein [Neobacillus sp. SuZ13]
METINWKWYQIKKDEEERIQPIFKQDRSGCNEWLNQVRNNKTNSLRIRLLDTGEKVVTGSLIYKQNFEEEGDYKIFHYYVTEDQLITVDLNFSTLKHIRTEPLFRQIKHAENAVEGFFMLLGELMNEMLYEIDQFEEELKTLIWSIRKRNGTSILEKIYMRRHELLVWKSLLIPINELKIGIEEIKLNEVSRKEIFTLLVKRIERMTVLLNEYEHEIDSIINLEEVISSHRGNEIMKTLTVITILFTPIMALGALWGMNFKQMPELEWRYGYLLSFILIVISTLLLYGYLKFKGWTGDLLKGKKKDSFFK